MVASVAGIVCSPPGLSAARNPKTPAYASSRVHQTWNFSCFPSNSGSRSDLIPADSILVVLIDSLVLDLVVTITYSLESDRAFSIVFRNMLEGLVGICLLVSIPCNYEPNVLSICLFNRRISSICYSCLPVHKAFIVTDVLRYVLTVTLNIAS
jgi:hypothetical protein